MDVKWYLVVALIFISMITGCKHSHMLIGQPRFIFFKLTLKFYAYFIWACLLLFVGIICILWIPVSVACVANILSHFGLVYFTLFLAFLVKLLISLQLSISVFSQWCLCPVK